LLIEELEKARKERERTVPIDRVPAFRDDALVLGAGSVLLAAGDSPERPRGVGGADEARLLVLLSAAYNRRIGAEVLGHLRRAEARWRDGDLALASVHLALTGLGSLPSPRESSRRLFLAGCLIDSGWSTDTVLKALDLEVGSDQLRRVYNPDQPRVSAGNGRESGQWTAENEGSGAGSEQASLPSAPSSLSGDATTQSEHAAPSAEDAGVDALAGVTLSPAQEQAAREAAEQAIRALKAAAETSLERLSQEQIAILARLAAKVPAVVVFAGVLLTPTNATLDEENAVPGRPGFFYEHLPGEVGWRVTYVNDRGEGVEVSAGPDGMYRDAHGQPFGRLLPNGAILFATSGTLPDQTKHPPPEVCPAPTKDKFGQGPGSRSTAYANQMKHLLNPEAPTPNGYGRALPNASRATGIVIFDDCWLLDGGMFEYKGPGYAGLINASANSDKPWKFQRDWIDQSLDEVTSAQPGRQVVWLFAEPESAQYASNLFHRLDQGREKIVVGVFPYLGD
jgi:hypothetical protein